MPAIESQSTDNQFGAGLIDIANRLEKAYQNDERVARSLEGIQGEMIKLMALWEVMQEERKAERDQAEASAKREHERELISMKHNHELKMKRVWAWVKIGLGFFTAMGAAVGAMYAYYKG